MHSDKEGDRRFRITVAWNNFILFKLQVIFLNVSWYSLDNFMYKVTCALTIACLKELKE